MPAEDCRSQRGSTRFGTRSFKSRRPIAWKCGQVLAKTLSMPLPTTSFSVIWRTPRKPTAARDTWQFSTICRFLIARGVVVLSATRHGTRRLPSVAKQTHSWPGVKIILLGGVATVSPDSWHMAGQGCETGASLDCETRAVATCGNAW